MEQHAWELSFWGLKAGQLRFSLPVHVKRPRATASLTQEGVQKGFRKCLSGRLTAAASPSLMRDVAYGIMGGTKHGAG